MRYLILFTFSCLLLFTACETNEAVTALKTDTEEIHDVAMADLADLKRTKRNLRKEMAKKDSIGVKPSLKDSILDVFTLMSKAEEDMNNWMINYKEPDENMPKEAALKYLSEQHDFMQQNSKDILKATSGGKVCLEELKVED